MRRRFALAAVLVLAAMPVLAGPAAAKDQARAEHDRIVASWTTARLKAAIPRDFVKVGGSFKPSAKPDKPPGGGGGGSGALSGASWNCGGAILASSC